MQEEGRRGEKDKREGRKEGSTKLVRREKDKSKQGVGRTRDEPTVRCWKIEKEKRDKRLVHSQLSLHLTSMGVHDILVFKFEIYLAPACIQHTCVKSSPSDGANQTHLPSKAPKQNDPTTGGEETLRCRSGDPCSSPANHPPYNSPKRHDRGWWWLMSGHLHFHVKKCG